LSRANRGLSAATSAKPPPGCDCRLILVSSAKEVALLNPFINRMRGVLAILVALSHANAACNIASANPDAFLAALTPFTMFSGFNYVIGFVVLSGYCVARSTMTAPFSFTRYIRLRATRIYPALIVGALLAGTIEFILLDSPSRIAMWNTGIDLRSFLMSMLGYSGFSAQFGAYAPTYTVSYELLYYVIWGTALVIAPSNAIAIGLSIVSIPILFALLPANFGFALVVFAPWLIGAALAVHERRIIQLVSPFPLWAAWLTCLLLFFYGNGVFRSAHLDLWSYPGSLVTIPCAIIFAAIIVSHLAKDGPRLSMDDWLGDISYPLFLSHGPVVIAVASAVKAVRLRIDFGPMLFLMALAAFVVAQAMVTLVERPIMSWRLTLRSPRSGPDFRNGGNRDLLLGRDATELAGVSPISSPGRT
jgi:peptidoglycan/LPS O-acetylase OafA/YrhL